MNAALSYLSRSDEDLFEPESQQTSSAQVVSVGALSDWQRVAVKKVLGLRLLKSNWDSYGSRPISTSVIFTAISLLSFASLDNLPSPSVVPVSGGAIQLAWTKGGRELELEVRDNGTIAYLTVENGQPLDEEPLLVPEEAEHLLSWLNAG